jgi:hypothetical protein
MDGIVRSVHTTRHAAEQAARLVMEGTQGQVLSKDESAFVTVWTVRRNGTINLHTVSFYRMEGE